jgi:hypothetical protein
LYVEEGFAVERVSMERNNRFTELFMFAWIREMLPPEGDLADEPASLSDVAFYLTLALAGAAALAYAAVTGFFMR